jgi:hypothetical protein
MIVEMVERVKGIEPSSSASKADALSVELRAPDRYRF